MKKLAVIDSVVSWFLAVAALVCLMIVLGAPTETKATFTEFYCQTGGTNINAGSEATNAAAFSFTSGDWNNAGRYTNAGATMTGVAVGMWVSVFTNSDTVTTYIARITAVDTVNKIITVSTAAAAGTSPQTVVGTISVNVGGAWKGPYGAQGFPFNFVAGTLTNSSGNSPRVNFKNSDSNVISAAITHSANSGPIVFEGYTTTVGDGGRIVLDGGTTGASYILLTVSGKNNTFVDFVFQNNGATSSSDGVSATGSENLFLKCVFHDFRGSGVLFNAINSAVSCEAYRCDNNNSNTKGGFNPTTAGCTLINCFSHHNTNSSACGFQVDTSVLFVGCIASHNGASGFRTQGDVNQNFINCSLYGNGGSGIEFTTAGPITDPACVNIMNCTFLTNTSAAVRVNDTAGHYLSGICFSNAFGMGTMTNSGGNFLSTSGGASHDGSSIDGLNVSGIRLLSNNLDPFTASETGNFTPANAAIKNTGLGFFLETYTNSTWTGTVGYPDIGAAQHIDSASASSYTFSQ